MNRALHRLLILPIMLMAGNVMAMQEKLTFGVIAASDKDRQAAMVHAITQTNKVPLSFVVMQGIKQASEPCTDTLYQQRKSVLDGSHHPLFLSMTGADWTQCLNRNKRSVAIERLQRLREIFHADAESLGKVHLSLQQQSMIASFRIFAENTRWEQLDFLFATLNIPAPNNHWQSGGGSKSEFEDRTVANTDWLQRMFKQAMAKNLRGIVIFSDADITDTSKKHADKDGRDGFREVRALVHKLAKPYKGRVLLVARSSSQTRPGKIQWDNNIGVLVTPRDWLQVEAGAFAETFRVLPPSRQPTQQDAVASEDFFLDK